MAETTSSSSSSTSSGGGLSSILNPVGAIAGIGTSIAGAIAGITDIKKRREIEGNLMLMSATERADLEKKVAASNNKNDRITILVNAVLRARDDAAKRDQRSKTVKWILIGAFGLGTLALLAWYLKKK